MFMNFVEEVCSVRLVTDDDWPGVGGGAFHHGGAAEMQRRKTKLAIFYVIPPIFSPFKTYRGRGFAFFSEIYWVYGGGEGGGRRNEIHA